jgi:hypothetical protein
MPKKENLKVVLNLLEEKLNLIDDIIELSYFFERICASGNADKLRRLIKSQNLRIEKLENIDYKIKCMENEIEIPEDLFLINKKNIFIKIKKIKNKINTKILLLTELQHKNRKLALKKNKEIKFKYLKILQGKKIKKTYKRSFINSTGVFLNKKSGFN